MNDDDQHQKRRRWKVLLAIPAVAIAMTLAAGPVSASTATHIVPPINQEVHLKIYTCNFTFMFGNIWGTAFAKVRPDSGCVLDNRAGISVGNGTGQTSAYPYNLSPNQWNQAQVPGYVAAGYIRMCGVTPNLLTGCVSLLATPF